MSIILSICIPTHNFGQYIGDTLESILAQTNDRVEVIVFDSASTDNTPEIVQSYLKRFPKLRYYRNEKKRGIDRDMAETVNLAQGEYCWLFSSDDIMKEGAISRVLEEIKGGHDVYITGFTNCGIEISMIREEYQILNVKTDRVFNLTDRAERLYYFSKAIKTPAFFSFMSSLICKKISWDRGVVDNKYIGSCWAHVARIFSLIPGGLSIKFLVDSLLYRRSFNDSFASNGIIRRVEIAVLNFQTIADDFFGCNSDEALYVKKSIRREILFRLLIKAKALVENKCEAKKLYSIVRTLYSKKDLLSFVYLPIYFILPLSICRVLKFLYFYVYKFDRPSVQ